VIDYHLNLSDEIVLQEAEMVTFTMQASVLAICAVELSLIFLAK
jgi:hypothetical protein